MSRDTKSDPTGLGLVPLSLTWGELRDHLAILPFGDSFQIEFSYTRSNHDVSTSQLQLEEMAQKLLNELGVSCKFQVQGYREGSDPAKGKVRVQFKLGPQIEDGKLICPDCNAPNSTDARWCNRCGEILK